MVLSQEIMLAFGLQVEDAVTVIRPVWFCWELGCMTLRSDLPISTPTMALVASIPSTLCVALFIWLVIFVLVLSWKFSEVLNILGPELSKPTTADFNVPSFVLIVWLLTGTVTLRVTVITLLPAAEIIFDGGLRVDFDCAYIPPGETHSEIAKNRTIGIVKNFDLIILKTHSGAYCL
jgi:hypothetical protein